MLKTLFSTIPFVGEIMNSPKLKPYIERLHPSAVLATVKGVYDDVSGEMYSAASQWRKPDLSEIIEKVIARLQVSADKEPEVKIDGRGILLSQKTSLANSALEGMIWAIDDRTSLTEKTLTSLICKLTGAEDAIVFANPVDAKLAVIRTFAVRERILIARRDLYEDDFGVRLEDLFRIFSVHPIEVGASNKITLQDYKGPEAHKIGLVWMAVRRHTNLTPPLTQEEFRQFHDSLSEFDIPIIGDIALAPIRSLANYFSDNVPALSDYVKWGYDLVLCGGAQLIGGPDCGIVLGSKKFIDEIRATRIASFLTAHRVDLAGLYKTLLLYNNQEDAETQIPILRILSTSTANLHNRAERLAPQIGSLPLIENIEIIEGKSRLYESFDLGVANTILLKIKPADRFAEQLAHDLEQRNPGLLVRMEADHLLIDLRSVDPVYDSILVEIFEKIALSTNADNVLPSGAGVSEGPDSSGVMDGSDESEKNSGSF